MSTMLVRRVDREELRQHVTAAAALQRTENVTRIESGGKTACANVAAKPGREEVAEPQVLTRQRTNQTD